MSPVWRSQYDIPAVRVTRGHRPGLPVIDASLETSLQSPDRDGILAGTGSHEAGKKSTATLRSAAPSRAAPSRAGSGRAGTGRDRSI